MDETDQMTNVERHGQVSQPTQDMRLSKATHAFEADNGPDRCRVRDSDGASNCEIVRPLIMHRQNTCYSRYEACGPQGSGNASWAGQHSSYNRHDRVSNASAEIDDDI
ncbi:hypothetical protein FQN55_007967 [Onygenales sp. PD_40]|nr:hypothetical protein FQN55_007967 [Onygenales sp. PD_40]KAK2803401.1 hypothetical protein FQN51_003508 [Onygenales sp. PD_10]